MRHDQSKPRRTRMARLSLGLGGLISAITLSSPAQAWVVPAPLFATLGCSSAIGTQAPSAIAGMPVNGSKSAAILGGQLSALERIALQQEGAAAAASDPQAVAMPVAMAPTSPTACEIIAAAATQPAAVDFMTPARSDELLGSSLISIGKTPFDSAWQRVSSRPLSRSSVDRLLGRPDSQGLELVELVNRWVNNNIQFVRDEQLYKQRDFWATARQTLTSRKGDCEDYAILKYQMLAALGFKKENMYLTITRDLVRQEDHSLLIVQIDDRRFVLDNATNTILPAFLAHDYRAIMTLNTKGSWIHGSASKPRFAAVSDGARGQLPYFSDSAVSRARETGLSK